ncbi:glucose 1-dehydrogenase [Shouchella clausii]|jgi:2-dehydro-3-deoxy-D-gluconate 5-dehydrogenase|uniref:2-deoxy-D-gluconate 3-dehydrogenase n=1 Tax=Shouchella clausii (strain KSM-K16) TaxID=66692 RepID=Q5WJ75_SHOC1|nr:MULTISPECIES: glucose 1-dehydrogenase [Shouchella]ALA51773.1 2-deoxy-D-gluconate 3-dehydrogenase [Shouchella clausii]KKI87216.1 3-ketoacyl-ACP reductase [Shouchella clausii]MBU3232190.1 glucose 1-dehydrogenase [Shouchella clausii]MBU3264480.1 glucose 1-dehydrogenase [Shouchella clausii]MBU3508641.1 glucose 1-dehydrogenase [Shouchella clausii]
MKNLFDLSGKVAVITGGSRGIGKGIATGLAHAGADLVLVQRTENHSLKSKLEEETGVRCESIQADLSKLEEVKQVIPQALDKMGKVDILINNAGIQRRSPAVDFLEQDWDAVMQVNLKAVWMLCQQAGKHMLANGQGKIINVASLNSFQGGINIPAYASAKGAVAQLTKALANEWSSKGINVNGIVPGYVATDMNEALIADPVRSRQILERIPAGRWGSADDFAGAAIYLASEASSYVHGHLLAVDGGWLGR